MILNIGDRVEVIDDVIFGMVTHIFGSMVTIETDDGFSMQFEISQLIQVKNSDSFSAEIFDAHIDDVIASKEIPKKKIKTYKGSSTKPPVFEVDLHIHQLTDSTKGMTNFDMLNLQLQTAQRQLEFAIKKRMPKVVFIHGVGEGVLKQELHTLLRRYDNVTFYDASFKTYGFGATEVKIFQNIKP